MKSTTVNQLVAKYVKWIGICVAQINGDSVHARSWFGDSGGNIKLNNDGMSHLESLEKRPLQVRSQEGHQNLLSSSSGRATTLPLIYTILTRVVDMDADGNRTAQPLRSQEILEGSALAGK